MKVYNQSGTAAEAKTVKKVTKNKMNKWSFDVYGTPRLILYAFKQFMNVNLVEECGL